MFGEKKEGSYTILSTPRACSGCDLIYAALWRLIMARADSMTRFAIASLKTSRATPSQSFPLGTWNGWGTGPMQNFGFPHIKV